MNDSSKQKPKGVALLSAYLEASGIRQLAETIRRSEVREGSSSAVAGFEPGRQPERAGMLCIGDSERMIPPFTGNGMSMAFEAAECAAGPLLAWAHHQVSWVAAANATRAALARKFRKRMAAAVFLEPATMRDAAANALAFFPPAVMTRVALPLLR